MMNEKKIIMTVIKMKHTVVIIEEFITDKKVIPASSTV